MSRKLLLTLALAAVAAGSLTCSPLYLLRAGYEEGKILSRRRPIAEVVADPSSSAEVRRKLALVLQARTFAAKFLGLAAGESYTTFSRVDRDTLLLVLSAAPKDRFAQVTWWFPLVGHVPYKGFFSFEAAREAEEELQRAGYDTYLRPSGAFGALGWFNDPVLSTVLRYDDVALVSTVIHELTHNTLFVPSRVSFNESFATFVGDRGAIEFFCHREGPDGGRCREARNEWADDLLFGRFLSDLIARLEAVYRRGELSRNERVARREEVFSGARERFTREVAPALLGPSYRGFGRSDLNNASLIARRLYYDRLELFESAFEAHGHDLRRTIQAVREGAGRGADPYAGLSSLAARP